MKLKVLLPTEVLVEVGAAKIIAEAENGSFCLLPHHIDFVAALVPGLLSFTTDEGGEEFLAVDEGILVKCGPEVSVSTRHAVRGPDLGTLKQTIAEQFQVLDDREKKARSAAAKLEANLVRRFMELGEHGR
ncbi:MAG TPA: F0F1 ATP synthase subunit epsilon [Candidatus Tectomicrobia bacterium]|nr:F0F1 ATP synthase subunit epsilon [Candidatus Tectomicrobia bacterium]